jgi:hypothetical protein
MSNQLRIKKEHLYTHVYHSIIHKIQAMETTQMTHNR